MRLLEILLVVIALVALVWAGWTLLAGGLRGRAGRWEVRPHSMGTGTRICLEKPGEEPYVFRELPAGAPDSDVEDALIEAQARADSFNALLREG